ncbi:hypothetical protein A5742_09340 [Mycolicibacterium fortuitum]|uniref:Pyrrolo-quinoline quinone n=1 Tax=Mycolicibacterium fortuitum TaxID=1766 RepID=A0ABD6QF10_MYCFO|nr:PQQ-binding-like beta-propeller repeat protein [Mycolicibacterium fortuitum]OMC37403.1 hypothetical protein A5742_09340 [Mycolicibacterium fortuitum]
MTYPPAGFPPPSGPYSTPDPFQQAGQPPVPPGPFGTEGWQPPVFQAGYGQTPPTPKPPRSNKRWLVITVVVAVVIAAAGTGTLLWWLNARGGESGTATASPLPTSVPPLGALRPPRDQLVPSLEKPLGKPRWTYRPEGSTHEILGGDAYTVVVGVEGTKADGSRSGGVLALDAGNGAPRWPKPVVPAGPIRIPGYTAAKCVISRAATTIGCFFGRGGNTSGDEPDLLVFLDTATGAEKGNIAVPATRWGRVREIYSAGDGFVVALNDEVVGYRSDGSEAWRTPYTNPDPIASQGHEGVSVYGDQAIVITVDGRVLDANSGRPILQGAKALGSAAFAAGFGLSDGDTFDFYDFAGTKTASVPSEGFTFIDGYGTGGYSLSVGLDRRASGSSGLYSPLVYNEATGHLRAFDPAAGGVLWTRQISQGDTPTAKTYTDAYGNGTTCFIILRKQQDTHMGIQMKVQKCETDSDNPVVDAPVPDNIPTSSFFAGSDGQRMLFDTGNENHDEVAAIDGTTGQEAWRKTNPNVWLPRWIGSGVYSASAKGMFRWF